jgi:hypothetical protein
MDLLPHDIKRTAASAKRTTPVWVLVCAFCWTQSICRAETTKEGAISDAEFVIEKQKENKLSQEKKLFFKAPLPTVPIHKVPWQTIQPAEAGLDCFEPAPTLLTPFYALWEQRPLKPVRHCARIGITSQWLPYILCRFQAFPLGEGMGSTQLSWVPPTMEQKWKAGSASFTTIHRNASWLFRTKLTYQQDRHAYLDIAPPPKRTLHQIRGRFSVEQADDHTVQYGTIEGNSLHYQNHALSEQLLQLQYKWLRRYNGFALQAATYSDFAYYKNEKVAQKRFIVSAKPGIRMDFLPSIQLKGEATIAYHNDPIPNFVSHFQVYPSVKVSSKITDWLQPYLRLSGMGVGGNVVPLHLCKAAAKQAFVAKEVTLSHKHQYLTVQGGNKGTVGSIAHQLHIAYRQFRNAARRVFAADQTTYTLLYHTHPSHTLKTTLVLHGTVPGVQQLGTTAKVTYCHTFQDAAAPMGWYAKPTLTIKPMLRYTTLHQKLFLTGGCIFRNSALLKDAAGMETNLKPTIDVHVGADYLLTPHWAVFLTVDNLLDRKNCSYARYHGIGRTLLGGIQYRW